ncbi:hypothetical protein FGB62_56g18 [Gracilaria domingensis]|nr:hypothetical protein FGB62_56g18 [Gracilaria domingensis]
MDYTPVALYRQTRAFAVVRSPDWQGPEARAGPRLAAAADGDAREVSMLPTHGTAPPRSGGPSPNEGSVWHRIESLLGAQRGEQMVKMIKEHVTKHVRSLSLAEIERMA